MRELDWWSRNKFLAIECEFQVVALNGLHKRANSEPTKLNCFNSDTGPLVAVRWRKLAEASS